MTEVQKPRGLSFLVRTRQIMCTNSAVMEELVCLSSKWNILEVSNPAVSERWHEWIRQGGNGLAMVPPCH